MEYEAALSWAASREGMQAAREYLSSAQRLDAMIALRLSRLDMLRDRARQITRAIEPWIRTRNRGDLMANAASDAVDMEEELLRDYARLLKMQKEIHQLISDIPDDYQKMVLDLKYLQGVSLVGIARRINYDERTVQRIHDKALQQAALRLALKEDAPSEGSPVIAYGR